MEKEAATRYMKSAIQNPKKFLIAGMSEVTSRPREVQFGVCGEETPLLGELPDTVVRYAFLMDGIRDYEPETLHMMQQIIKKEDSVLVVGAHVGIHAVCAKQLVGDKGLVVAFEPTPDTFDYLQKNCEPRGIVAERLAITRPGIQEVKMTAFEKKYAAWNSVKDARTNNSEKWNPRKCVARATSIDKYCEDNSIQPNVILLDLENGEHDALLGSIEVIENFSPDIVLECGDLGRSSENSTRSTLSFLKDRGYNLLEVDSNTNRLVGHEIKDTYPAHYPNVLATKRTNL